MGSCVVRESLPEVANVMVPRSLDLATGSSVIFFSRLCSAEVRLGRVITPPGGLPLRSRAPFRGRARLPRYAPLHHEARDHAKEARSLPDPGVNDLAEARRAERRPVGIYLNRELGLLTLREYQVD